jgi:hypothetical protein
LHEILDRDRPTKRRSAGLPYLLLGALSGSTPGNPNVRHAFERIFSTLSSSSASSATKSHAVNCLRVLFLDGKLAATVKTYLEQAFVVAVEDFGAAE